MRSFEHVTNKKKTNESLSLSVSLKMINLISVYHLEIYNLSLTSITNPKKKKRKK